MATNILPLPITTRSAPAAGFTAKLVRGFFAFVRLLQRRHELRMLAGFDDRMLADIGLTRGDLRDAVAQPMWHDPTAILVSRVCERRQARHAVGLVRSARELKRTASAPPIVPALEDTARALLPARSRYY
jgi:uncharacterized protein YjiS (DUF1127 family)